MQSEGTASEDVASPNGASIDGENIVRLRGLPWSCNDEQLKKFFKGKNFSIFLAFEDFLLFFQNVLITRLKKFISLSPEKAVRPAKDMLFLLMKLILSSPFNIIMITWGIVILKVKNKY